jgi:predicted component of type VI protein secretion system
VLLEFEYIESALGNQGLDTMKLEWQVNGKKQYKYVSHEMPLIIGRSKDCDIVLLDLYVSRHHAVIGYEDGYLKMRTLNAKNPITVNGCVQVCNNDSYIVRDGDIFSFGRVQMKASSPILKNVQSKQATMELKTHCQNCGGRAVGIEANCVWCGATLFDQAITSDL